MRARRAGPPLEIGAVDGKLQPRPGRTILEQVAADALGGGRPELLVVDQLPELAQVALRKLAAPFDRLAGKRPASLEQTPGKGRGASAQPRNERSRAPRQKTFRSDRPGERSVYSAGPSEGSWTVQEAPA